MVKPGVSAKNPSPARYSSTARVVFFPRPMRVLRSPVCKPRSGKIRFRSVDFPTPEAPENAELSWEEDYCAISYVAYAADAESAEALEPVSRKLYYASTARY